MTMEHGCSFASTLLGLGMKLASSLRGFIISKRFGHAPGHLCSFQGYLCDIEATGLQKPDLSLAKGQDIKCAVTTEEGEKRFDIEVGGNDGQIIKLQGQTIDLK